MATLYVDLAISGGATGDGTTGTPWDLVRFLANYEPSDGEHDIVYIAGTADAITGTLTFSGTERTSLQFHTEYVGVNNSTDWTEDGTKAVLTGTGAFAGDMFTIKFANGVWRNITWGGAGKPDDNVVAVAATADGQVFYKCSFPTGGSDATKAIIDLVAGGTDIIMIDCEVGTPGSTTNQSQIAISVGEDLTIIRGIVAAYGTGAVTVRGIDLVTARLVAIGPTIVVEVADTANTREAIGIDANFSTDISTGLIVQGCKIICKGGTTNGNLTLRGMLWDQDNNAGRAFAFEGNQIVHESGITGTSQGLFQHGPVKGLLFSHRTGYLNVSTERSGSEYVGVDDYTMDVEPWLATEKRLVGSAGLRKNGASQIVVVKVVNRVTGDAVTGLSSGLDADVDVDGTNTNLTHSGNFAEVGSGYYALTLPQAQTNGDLIVITFGSSNADHVFDPPSLLLRTTLDWEGSVFGSGYSGTTDSLEAIRNAMVDSLVAISRN